MSSREVKDYLSHHHISPLLESLLTGLLYHRPEDPVGFLKSCLITTGLMGGPQGIKWDTFIHLHTKPSVTPGTKAATLSTCIVPSTAPPELPTPLLPPSTPLLPLSTPLLPTSSLLLPSSTPLLSSPSSLCPSTPLLPSTPLSTPLLPQSTPLLPPARPRVPSTPLLCPSMPLSPLMPLPLPTPLLTSTPLLPPSTTLIVPETHPTTAHKSTTTPLLPLTTPEIQPLTKKPLMPPKALNIPPTPPPIPTLNPPQAALLPPPTHRTSPRTPSTPSVTTTSPISTVPSPVTPSRPPRTNSGPPLPSTRLKSHDVASDPPRSWPAAPQTAPEHRTPQEEGGAGVPPVDGARPENRVVPEEGGAGAPPVEGAEPDGDVQRKDVHSQLSIDSDSDMTESLGLRQEVGVLFPPRPRPLIVFIIGGPGSGKGSQAAKLSHAFGLRSISLDDLLRKQLLSRTSPSRRWDLVSHVMGLGELEAQEDSVSELRGQLAAQREVRGFVVEGFPRDVHQALSFQDQVGSPDLVVLLLCSNETLRCRLQRRAATLGLLGDGGHALQRRLDSFQRNIVSISRYYRHLHLLAQVDADRDEDVVFADLSLLIKDKLSMVATWKNSSENCSAVR